MGTMFAAKPTGSGLLSALRRRQHLLTGCKQLCRTSAWVRLGSLEFRKKGVSRFDMRDPIISQSH
jgi:hypothetical protein